nr:hypothetical protein [uncultured Duganella sp.]
MKRFLCLLLLGTAAGLAAAGPETLSTCAEERAPVAKWAPAGADTVVCHQMVAGAGIDQKLVGRNSEKMAAFRKGVLVAIRPSDEADPHALNAPVYQSSEWLEAGSTGVPGELWWGRTATRHVFVGQESSDRLRKASALVPASLRPAQQDYMMRQMMAMVRKQPMAAKPGDERFKLFPKDQIKYAQHAATTASFESGFGGDGSVPPGKVSNARLELRTQPTVNGTLEFDLVVDGQTRHFTLPVVVPSGENHLRAAKSGAADALVCNNTWGSGTATSASDCIIENGANFKELYNATGAFFGDHANLAAVHFSLRVNSPSRNRNGETAVGVIVLKAWP